MKTLNLEQLKELLNSIDGKQAMFATIVYTSDARITKKDRDTKTPTPVNEAFWYQELTVNLNVNYENSVNRQLNKEGKDQLTFQKQERAWGQQVNDGQNGSLIEHNGRYYLQAIPNQTHKRELIDIHDRNIDWLKNWDVFPKKSKPKNQGTDKPIEVRSYKLSRIRELRLNGERYKIEW